MNNIIIDNVLDSDNIKLLKNIINAEIKRKDIWLDSYVDYSSKNKEQYLAKKEDTVAVNRLDFARIDLHNLKIPTQIIECIAKKLTENNFLNYKYCGSSTAWFYSKDFGNPKLTEHIDHTEDENTIMIDYQLDSNTSWGITVENNVHVLLNNQALIFCGKKQKHSRPFKKFNENEFMINVMFRFNPNESIYS